MTKGAPDEPRELGAPAERGTESARATVFVLPWRRHAMRDTTLALWTILAVLLVLAAPVLVEVGLRDWWFGIVLAAWAPPQAYFVFALWLNSTTIRLDSKTLRVSRGPLPGLGACAVERAEIVGVKLRLHGWVGSEPEHSLAVQLREGGWLTVLHRVLPDPGNRLEAELGQWIARR